MGKIKFLDLFAGIGGFRIMEKAAAVKSDRQLYKQAGNAVTDVVYEIAKRFVSSE